MGKPLYQVCCQHRQTVNEPHATVFMVLYSQRPANNPTGVIENRIELKSPGSNENPVDCFDGSGN